MIRIEQLNFSVGAFALRDVSLHVGPGEYFVLLGPTGSGKTLLVECLCGLNRIDSGRIYIDGREVTSLESRHRGVGYVPQDYALFPHQNVRGNVAFGQSDPLLRRMVGDRRWIGRIAGYIVYLLVVLMLRPLIRLTGRPFGIRFDRPVSPQVARVMDTVGVAHLADRFPGKLSGGERQRVALARALAIEPKILLLDEPVSALDEQTRDNLCRQLKQLQKSTKTTTVHVCHNFVEMLTVADRVGIIEQGRILQVGTPQEILDRPNSARVARFVQAGNLFSARAEPDGEWVRLACAGGVEFRAPRPDSGCPVGEVVVMVRPENIDLAPARPEGEKLPPGTTILEGAISEVVDLGPVVRVSLACLPSAGDVHAPAKGREVELFILLGKKEYNHRRVGVGEHVHLTVAAEDLHVMQQ